MPSHREKRPDGRRGPAASTPRDKKDQRYITELYSIRLSSGVRKWLTDNVPSGARSRFVEAAILYCVELAKNEDLANPFMAYRSGVYWGCCKGVVLGREETDHNVEAEIDRLWAALEQEIAQSTPRHWHAPMPARMMRLINRPLDEILGMDATDGPDARKINRGVGVPPPKSPPKK